MSGVPDTTALAAPTSAAAPGPPTSALPIARVAVDVPLPHLDRLFDYLVPRELDDLARPGVRVKVRFAGQLVNGYLLDRVERSEHHGPLARLARVVSGEPVLTAAIARLARAVADRYAGTLADVLRLAVPPRHAAVEAGRQPPGDGNAAQLRPVVNGDPAQRRPAVGRTGECSLSPPVPGPWAAYPGGPAFLAALAGAGSPRAVWTALPGAGWVDALSRAVAATAVSGRGALVVAPDGRDVAVLHSAFTRTLAGSRPLAALTADVGPAERYRRWLAIRRGEVDVVVGTRAAMFAPIGELGLVAVWDDGDDLHAEPRAPYPHAREVLCLRAAQAGAAIVIGGHARTAEGARLLATGWARPLVADRATVRAVAPRVRSTGDDAHLARDPSAAAARLPTVAWQAARSALTRGPVLVQVPRRGYLPSLACDSCRGPARCERCRGPLSVAGLDAPTRCGWCGHTPQEWECPECGGRRWRARVVGARRTADELGRAFPSVRVLTSGRSGMLATVGSDPALVIATPGAEPVASGGYAAALLLDGWALLSRPGLRAAEEALRRWINAAALVRPTAQAGVVVVCAGSGFAPVQALLRWDPATHADRELADRTTLGFPPAARVAALTGTPEAVADLLDVVRLPASAHVLGPVPVDFGGGPPSGAVRALVRAPLRDGEVLADSLRSAQGVRSAHRAAEPVQVRIDPVDL